MLRKIMKAVIPYGIVEWRRRQFFRITAPIDPFLKQDFHAARKKLIAQAASGGFSPEFDYDYADAVNFLIQLGVPEGHLKEGSIPESSLNYISHHIRNNVKAEGPLLGLHIGNFVGISLCSICDTLRSINEKSLVVAVDPNITHREINNPHRFVASLVNRYRQQSHILPVIAYSHNKSVSNDGVVFGGYNPADRYAEELGCENAIANIGRLCCHAAFDVALVDGNHEAAYLKDEIKLLEPVIRDGGLLILDDVDDAWSELRDVYRSTQGSVWADVGTDGRVGILRKGGASLS